VPSDPGATPRHRTFAQEGIVRNVKSTAWLCPVLAFGLVAAACGESDAGLDSGDGGDAGAGSGTVDISGSSTVAPVSTRVAELFEDVNPDIVVNVDGPGTGDGFALFCEGATDISDASRPIKAEEAEACEAAGIAFMELKVAIDGLSVVTSPANDVVECLTFADLYALSGPESQGIDRWDDAEEIAGELGSTTDLPDAPLTISAPGEESGTYDSYVEIVIEEFNEERGTEPQTRPDYQSSADDNVIIQGITGSDSSFGWVGYAFAREADVRSLEIDGGGGCVAPTDETIASGEYPIARDLYIYVNAAAAEESTAIVEYVDFYLSDDGLAAVPAVGYVSLAKASIEETRSVWEARETGTRDGG
jgi:phosphate transport system substrate-binding protein